ncbi:BPSS1780 family membrane protein [Burkholderia alba]|uniref:BPSS1780 family membrane protein n=1 Tax=Burkholderia alba TaxID=2683677 RepID=UPI002B059676|nr:BPSS1780 family membrane protein [Burkholderia alba]
MNIDYLSGTQEAARRNRKSSPSLPEGREVGAARCAQWLASGWDAARERPLLWLGAILACADFATLLELAPVLRPLAMFFAPGLAAALMFVMERARNGKPAGLREVIEAVNARRNALIAIGLYGAAMVLVGYVFTFGLRDVLQMAPEIARGIVGMSGSGFAAQGGLDPVLEMPVFAVAIAAAWFAPALVMLHDVSPVAAMVASIKAVLRNWRVTAIYLLAMTGGAYLVSLAELPAKALMLTPLLIAVPLLSMYGAYRDIFGGR